MADSAKSLTSTLKTGISSHYFTSKVTKERLLLRPVLLMHGLLDSADSFVTRGKSSIAMSLTEAGYDMWAGNCRGNKYARRHVTLSPEEDSQKFWNFSFDEMSLYDLPAQIDFILQKTGKEKLSAIAHSQGTTLFYVLGFMKPEYNDKISISISLAPIAHNNNVGLETKTIFNVWPDLSPFLKLMGHEEFLGRDGITDKLIEKFCSQGKMSYDFCERGIVSAIIGEDSEQLEPEFFNVVLGHFPAGTSRKNLDHLSQITRKGYLAPYDYGLLNAVHYGSLCTDVDKILTDGRPACPPMYDMKKVTMPTALIVGGKDKEATVSAAERLRGELPNVVHFQIIESFNHADYVWAKDLQIYMNPILKASLSEFA